MNHKSWRETQTHIYFWGSFLSNFWWTKTKLSLGGIYFEYHSSEQIYMALKAIHFGAFPSPEDAKNLLERMQEPNYFPTTAFEKILMAPDAKSAKAEGRLVPGFDPEVWDKVSYPRMRVAVLAKFVQNDSLRNYLFETGDKVLVEASPLDKIWGVGLHETDDRILDEANWLGENRLGKVLMDVRKELRDTAT